MRPQGMLILYASQVISKVVEKGHGVRTKSSPLFHERTLLITFLRGRELTHGTYTMCQRLPITASLHPPSTLLSHILQMWHRRLCWRPH